VSLRRLISVVMEVADDFYLFHSQTWRSVFYLSAGIAALVAVGGMLTVEPDQPSEEEDKRVDWVGSALITAGLTLIIFVLSEAAIAPRGWRTPCEYQCCLDSSADPHAFGNFRVREADVNL